MIKEGKKVQDDFRPRKKVDRSQFETSEEIANKPTP